MLGFGSNKKINELTEQVKSQSEQIEALNSAMYTHDGIMSFDGEKTEGELGSPKIAIPEYIGARERAWELQLTNDVAKLVMNKFSKWVIGKGLRFNSTPELKYISGINQEQFIENVEYRFRLYQQSTNCDYSSMANFHRKALEAYYNSKVSGDVLVILRVKNKNVNIQLIDGANIQTPLNYGKDAMILDGVEYDETGKHVAYHVLNEDLKFTRVPAYHKPTGLRLAFLVYGSKFRLNETRGLPMLIEDFEKIKNIERYVDATVKNAEISSELILVNEHDNSSTGEDIFKTGAGQGLSGKTNKPNPIEDLPTAKVFQKNMSRMTKAAVMNNTIGATLKHVKADAESLMPDFLESNLKLVFASAGIPYEVALSVYNSNYSASRAAIKDWEHILKVETFDFSSQFYEPFYRLWLYNEVTLGNIAALPLIKSYRDKDFISIEAINKASFIGVSVPSIDPLKEVNAVRKALGDEKTPLMDYETATETISQRDYKEVQQQVTKERSMIAEPLEETEKTEQNGFQTS